MGCMVSIWKLLSDLWLRDTDKDPRVHSYLHRRNSPYLVCLRRRIAGGGKAVPDTKLQLAKCHERQVRNSVEKLANCHYSFITSGRSNVQNSSAWLHHNYPEFSVYLRERDLALQGLLRGQLVHHVRVVVPFPVPRPMTFLSPSFSLILVIVLTW